MKLGHGSRGEGACLHGTPPLPLSACMLTRCPLWCSQYLTDAVAQSASNRRSQRAVSIVTDSQSDSAFATTRRVRNINPHHAITIEYFEVRLGVSSGGFAVRQPNRRGFGLHF